MADVLTIRVAPNASQSVPLCDMHGGANGPYRCGCPDTEPNELGTTRVRHPEQCAFCVGAFCASGTTGKNVVCVCTACDTEFTSGGHA